MITAMRIAVTGAAGGLGGQVVDLLAAGGEHEVVAVARRPLPAHPAPAVRRAVADYEDPAALRAALAGAEVLVLVSSDGPVGGVARHHEHLVGAAVACEVEHVVVLSGLDADAASPFCYAWTAAHLERLVRDAGCSCSIARAAIYTEFFRRWPLAGRATGELRLPIGDARLSLVSRDDVGRCLAALAVRAPSGGIHALTGRAAHDLDELAAIAARTWDVPMRYVPLTPHHYADEAAAAGEEPWWLYAFSSMFAAIREGRWTAVSDEVERLTGAPPEPVAAVLARAA